ncbi:hypothetical protein BpHYR1_019191, partial [Brachionus plicatilis]
MKLTISVEKAEADLRPLDQYLVLHHIYKVEIEDLVFIKLINAVSIISFLVKELGGIVNDAKYNGELITVFYQKLRKIPLTKRNASQDVLSFVKL